MKVLFHVCCGPCSMEPCRKLKEDGHSVTGFFYNPNIHPYTEMALRLDAVKAAFGKMGLELAVPPYDMERFFAELRGVYTVPERCRACWRMRLEAAAEFARKNGFDLFTTSLLISPYQDQGIIRKLGEDAAARSGIGFFYKDFRGLFRASQDRARAEGLYRQKYCGCVFSERERFDKKRSGRCSKSIIT